MQKKKKEKSLATILLAILLIGGFALGLHVTGLDSQIINPGLEGPKVYLNYIDFHHMFPSDWPGALNNHYLDIVDSQGHIVNVAETCEFINHSAIGGGDHVFWSSSQEGSPTVTWQHDLQGISKTFILSTDIENNIPLSDITQSGNPINPLNGNGSSLQINYPTISDVKQNPDGTISYNVTNTKLILASADFVLQFSITPHTSSGTVFSSGWSEGDWENVRMRFVLYWNTWLSSLLRNVGSDTSFNDQVPTIPADALNKQTAFKYIGGFPLTAWIGEWDPVVQNNAPTGIGDPIWFWKGNTPPASIPQNDLDNLKAEVNIRPDLKGHSVTLYSDMNMVVADNSSMKSNAVNDLEAMANTYTPDPTITPIQYFYVEIINLGTHATGSVATGWTVYFPCCYLRVHVVYGLRGTFTYLWTTQTQEDLGYPGYENRTITLLHVPGPFDWLAGLLSNPFFWLLTMLLTFLVILVILAIFAPGVLTLTSAAGKAGAKRLESKPKRRLCRVHPPFFHSALRSNEP